MDDTAQQVNNSQPIPAPTQTMPQAPVFHPHAVGGSKEAVPFSSKKIEAPISEYMQPTEVAPIIPQEVAEVVEVTPDSERPQLDDSHKAAGIEHAAPENVAHPVTPSGSVQLPYTFQEATEREKATTEDDSEHWLVQLSKYIMRKLAFKE